MLEELDISLRQRCCCMLCVASSQALSEEANLSVSRLQRKTGAAKELRRADGGACSGSCGSAARPGSLRARVLILPVILMSDLCGSKLSVSPRAVCAEPRGSMGARSLLGAGSETALDLEWALGGFAWAPKRALSPRAPRLSCA